MNFKLRVYGLAALITILFLQSCVPTGQLAENEKLLYKVKLTGAEQADKEQIENLYRQRPNTKLLGSTPYLSIYYFGKKFWNPEKISQKIDKKALKYDKKIEQAGSDSAKVVKLREKKAEKIEKLNKTRKEGNLLMRKIGEAPAIYDTTLTSQTMEQLDIYMHSKGFFRSSITHDTTSNNKKVTLNIKINEDTPFVYTHHAYTISDSAILQLVKQHENRSLIKTGIPFDADQITKERDRLEGVLRNNGYYEFRKQFITFEVDTSYEDYTVRVHTVIDNPSDSTFHQVFRIRKVDFYTDAGVNRFGITRDTILFNQVHYLSYQHKFKPKVLDLKLDIYPGQRYRLFRTNVTQKKLSDLDVFRFSTITYQTVPDDQMPDTAKTKLLDAVINVTPAKKFQYTYELGVNLTEQLPGPFTSLRIRVRNVLGGAEVMDIGFRGGLEGQFSPSRDEAVYKQELGTNLALTFPKIIFPFVNRTALSEYSPRTRIGTGYTYINRPEYIRTNADISWDYLWQKSQKIQHIFSPIDIDIIDTAKLDPAFRQYLNEIGSTGNTLIRSFTNAFVSSARYSVIYNTNDFIQTRDAKYIRSLIELGGLSNYIGLDYAKLINDELQTFKFGRVNLDFRRYKRFSENKFFVYRFNVGYARPFERNGLLPYDKYFFAGGGSSIRAWRPRKLGPGSYSQPFILDENQEPTNARDYRFEQPGEILLETNFEYRFNMFSFIDGALFVDAGNVWTLKEDPKRPGSQFEFTDFYNELAVATGLGFRFDFSFVILRVDVATKAIDPAEEAGSRFVLDRFRLNEVFNNEQTVINLGIGYPF